jgi:hypothetical protein
VPRVATAWLLSRALVLACSTALALAGIELAFRKLDGWPLWPLWGRLPLAEHTIDEPSQRRDERPDRLYVPGIPLAEGMRPEWYEQDPPPRARIPMTPELAARAAKYPNATDLAFTVWNREFLKLQVCAGVTDYGLGQLEDEYIFTAPEPGLYPIYRHLVSVSPPGWFVTNNFGWRGPDVDLNKDGRTIRIAFVGASTTIAPYYLPFSYPEFIGHWLSLWAKVVHPGLRIEVINAARTGIDSSSIAAIVRQEVAPLEPDLTVYYEGANSFGPKSTIRIPERWQRERPKLTFRPPSAIERRSALARRLTSFSVRLAAVDGREPAKGVYPLVWPRSVDEQRPDPDDPALPMGLARVVHDLDSMDAALRSSGGELAIESFMWFIPESGVPLDLSKHQAIYTYLNRTLWPVSYEHLRRMTTFQNRALKAYAAKRHDLYLEVASALPQDPDLFSDPIHMGEPGLRLQAWIVTTQLIPWINARLHVGTLPKAMRTPRTEHPAFVGSQPSLVSISSVKADCR